MEPSGAKQYTARSSAVLERSMVKNSIIDYLVYSFGNCVIKTMITMDAAVRVCVYMIKTVRETFSLNYVERMTSISIFYFCVYMFGPRVKTSRFRFRACMSRLNYHFQTFFARKQNFFEQHQLVWERKLFIVSESHDKNG